MAAPFEAIQQGLDVAMPGDTVHVAPGEYAAIRTVRDGSADARISVVATEPRMASILADGTGIELAHDHHTIEGLVVDCGYGSGDCIEGGGDAIALLDLEVRRSARDCIDLRDSSDVLVEASDIHHCVREFDPENNADAHGITGDSVFDLTVRNTSIRLVTGDSIQLSPGREPWGGLLVESCVLSAEALRADTNGWTAGTVIGENAFDSKVGEALDGAGQRPIATFRDVVATGWRGPISNAAAFNVKEEVDVRIDGVVVSDSEIAFRLRAPAQVEIANAVLHDVDVGFRMEDGLTSARVYNSTLGGNVTEAFVDGGGEPIEPDLRNLLFLAPEVPALASTNETNLAVDGGVFVDAEGHDYHLLEGAAPVDAGVDLPSVPADFDGVARPVGAAYDVGAFEWTDMPPGGETDGGTSAETTDGSESEGSSDGGDATSDGGAEGGGDGSGSSGAAATDSGTAGGDDDGGDGCSCRAAGSQDMPWLWVFFLGAVLRRRGTLLP